MAKPFPRKANRSARRHRPPEEPPLDQTARHGRARPLAAELETILTIGARVPDHGKLAPWRFIVFEGEARARAGEVIAKVFAHKNPNAAAAEIDIEKRRLTDGRW